MLASWLGGLPLYTSFVHWIGIEKKKIVSTLLIHKHDMTSLRKSNVLQFLVGKRQETSLDSEIEIVLYQYVSGCGYTYKRIWQPLLDMFTV